MKNINLITLLLVIISPIAVFSQSSYIPLATKDYDFLDRLEIKTGDSNLNFSGAKPYSRKLITSAVEHIDSLQAVGVLHLTDIDKYNIEHLLMNNAEWSEHRTAYFSKSPELKHFYINPANLLEINKKNFFLAVNPAIQYQQMFEKGNNRNLFFSSNGLSIRGVISNRIGFDLYVSDNHERDPLYVQEWIKSHAAVPGERYYKPFKSGGVSYFDNRGSVSINASKYIALQFGFDKNFIGDGMRSLFLSDFSGSTLFFKINTRIWKFNFENLYAQLTPNYDPYLTERKYFRMNYLSINATNWLNLGFFDAVIMGRKDHFDFQYLIPLMFLRPLESDIGSGDNALMGLTGKANIKKKIQIYGQLMFDEFVFKELIKSRGFWANKFGHQIGIKYPDAFGIKNLDLRLEENRVRPFTYSHDYVVSNYGHYNQPLAHPLGANFQEFIGVANFQPVKKLYLQAKAIYYYQGLDTAGVSYGSNIDLLYQTRTRDYGYYVGDGNTVKSLNINLLTSYEIKENFFIDANFQHRTYNLKSGIRPATTGVSIGFRWNMARRNFDF